MKTSFSQLAERQTIRIDRVNDRVSIRVRQLRDGTITRDVMVDGYCYTPAVSENWLARCDKDSRTNLQVIIDVVNTRSGWTHMGMGEWGLV